MNYKQESGTVDNRQPSDTQRQQGTLAYLTKFRNMRMSYSLRAFAIYFVILGSLIWFTLDNATERLNDGMRQSAESVIVDIANILAVFIEDEIAQNSPVDGKPVLTTEQIDRVFTGVKSRSLNANIYRINKTLVDSSVYITNHQGVIVYDSKGLHTGKDFSRWRDVNLTLQGEYGARTSFDDQNFTEPGDEKSMIIAAPIYNKGDIIGVISVLKPINSLEGHLRTESNQLQRYAFGLLMLALAVGYLLSLWFTYALNKIANYANAMAEAKKVDTPVFLDKRLADLSNSIANMRTQLDGKEYVEAYIHSLTHELKTPITSIGGAVELLTEDMPAEDRALFLKNIQTSNQRMSRLVDRMLSLAKLEGLTELVDPSEFDLLPTINRLLSERHATIEQAGIQIIAPGQDSFSCLGDRVLLSQAIANLLDNAINFCSPRGSITIGLEKSRSDGFDSYTVRIHNQGEAIPDYALEKIYDRFFSLPNKQATDAQSKSTGLGLSFVKEIMKLHRGSVHLSNRDSGVLATLRWPITD
ncbi:MAG: two-component system sensor histidine kinase CreC [Pseudomonadota bacterium]